MATTSGDLATLIFKRNISSTMENYVLDFQMLKVLDEIDGIRDVAAIAARLDTVVADVKATCARLFQQRLILPAQPHAKSILEPDLRSPSHAPPSDISQSLPGLTPDEAYEFEVEVEASPTSAPDTLPSAREVEQDPPQATLFDLKPGEDSQAAVAPLDEDDDAGSGAGAAGLWDRGDWGPESRSAPAAPNGSSDIFSIARTAAHGSGDTRSNGFVLPVEANRPGTEAGPQFAGGVRSGDSGGQGWPQRQGNTQAIEYFEEGLAFLQRGALKEALRQFEMALALDPENRLCRANIQRIQAKIASEEV